MIEKLRSEGHCAIYLTMFYCYLNDHGAKARVLAHSEGLQVGSPSRVDDSMVDKLRAIVIDNCGVVQTPTKKIVMEILGMER